MRIKNKVNLVYMALVMFSIFSVTESIAQKQNITFPTDVKKPKNIIVMISDGCGYNHILATNYYNHGEANAQPYESFPIQYAMSTYMAKNNTYEEDDVYNHGYDPGLFWEDFGYALIRPTDSGSAATAMSTGRKTFKYTIGMGCDKEPAINISEVARLQNKSTGVITSVQFAHATPAGFLVHNESRKHYVDIARDMIISSEASVIMGCGHPEYDDNATLVDEPNYNMVGGEDLWNSLQKDDATLMVDGEEKTVKDIDGDGEPDAWTFIEDSLDFVALTEGETPKRLIGVPKVNATLQHNRTSVLGEDIKNETPYQTPLNNGVPTLETMTKGAINVLDNDPDGFFLMIEGGAIDWAGHSNLIARLIEEETDFNNSVNAVIDWVESNSSWDETLLIVTADHETGFLWGPDAENNPFAELVNNGKGNIPGYSFNSGGHSNSLVPFFAKGAGSELFHLYADELDPVRGNFLNNTEIAQAVFMLWGLNIK